MMCLMVALPPRPRPRKPERKPYNLRDTLHLSVVSREHSCYIQMEMELSENKHALFSAFRHSYLLPFSLYVCHCLFTIGVLMEQPIGWGSFTLFCTYEIISQTRLATVKIRSRCGFNFTNSATRNIPLDKVTSSVSDLNPPTRAFVGLLHHHG